MKKIFVFILLLGSLKSLAQYPNGKQTLGNDSNVVEPKGGFHGRVINWRYNDTASANLQRISQYPGAQIVTGNTLWVRDSTATAWMPVSTLFDTTTIYLNDEKIYIYVDSLYGTLMPFQVLLDTAYRVNDSVFAYLYTNDSLRFDTLRGFISSTNIYDIVDTIPDSLWVNTQVLNGTDSIAVVHHGPTVHIDSLNVQIPESDPTHDGYMPKEAWVTLGGSGSVEYVIPGINILVDSLGRSYTVNADTTNGNLKLATQGDIINAVSGKQDALTLTTTGTSGAATLVGATLNIPQYSGGGGGSGTVTVVTGSAPVIITSTPTTTPNVTVDTTDATGTALATQNDLGTKADTATMLKYLFTNPTHNTLLKIDSINNRIVNFPLIATAPLAYNAATGTLSFTSSGTSWNLGGNAGITPATDYFGTSDDKNIVIKRNGTWAGTVDSTGNLLGRTMLGVGAGRNAAAGVNTAITAVGFKALTLLNSSTAVETAFGNRALASDVTGIRNAAFGHNAGAAITANDNTLVGYIAGSAVTGTDVTAVGASAMGGWTGSGSQNTAVGSGALNTGSGTNETAVGRGSFGGATVTGGNNTGLGYFSGVNNTSGANNLFLGFHAGHYNTTASNQIILSALDLTNYLGDTTKSPVYIRQSPIGIARSNILTFNGRIGVNRVNIDSNIVMELKDTAGAFLMPLMTTARKTGLTSRVIAVNTLVGGTGYTTGTYLNSPLTGGSGTNMLADIVVNGSGVVTGVTPRFGGYNYVVGDVLGSASIGGGSGFSVTVSGLMFAQKGMMVIDTTLKKPAFYDGILWTEGAKILSGSATLDFASTGAGAIADLTITVTGAADGDVVSLGVPNASNTATATFSAWVSAANTVTVRFSPKATEDPASGTFKVKVFKD